MTVDEPKVFACFEEAAYQALELWLSICYDCSIISKEHVPDEGIVCFGSHSEVEKVKQLAICPIVELHALS